MFNKKGGKNKVYFKPKKRKKIRGDTTDRGQKK